HILSLRELKASGTDINRLRPWIKNCNLDEKSRTLGWFIAKCRSKYRTGELTMSVQQQLLELGINLEYRHFSRQIKSVCGSESQSGVRSGSGAVGESDVTVTVQQVAEMRQHIRLDLMKEELLELQKWVTSTKPNIHKLKGASLENALKEAGIPAA